MVANPRILRRYTDLPAALYLLDRQAITLLDPISWDDTNDSHYLRRYKERRGLTTLLAICFTQAGESYHHWRAFTHGSAGTCIQFDRANLLQAVSGLKGIVKKDVKYLTLPQARAARPSVMDLPFVKRHGFEHEQEYRIIYASKTSADTPRDIPIALSCIVRVTLSPWLRPTFSAQVSASIRSIPGCEELEVVRSTLIGNHEWKHLADPPSGK